MGVLNPNSTPYVHPNEPNLLNIHKAMEYRDGIPHLRVNLGSDNITITGDVNLVDTVNLSSSTLAALETISVQNTVSVTVSNFPTTSTVYQGTDPWRTTVTNWPALQYVNGTLYAVQSGTWSVGVTGNVTVNNFTSTVNIASMPAVSGTVAISSLPAVTVSNFTSTVYVTNFTSTVHVDNFPTSVTVTNFTSTVNIASLPAVSGTVAVSSLPAVTGTVTVSNTSFAVTNFPTTSTVYQGTNPWTITGTVAISSLPEVEIKNDVGNPVPISGNVTATLTGSPSVNITGLNLDAFARLRVSNPVTFFDSALSGERRYDWSSSTSTGATVTFDLNANVRKLNVTANSGSEVIRESIWCFPYQPGKSLLVMASFCMAPSKTGLRQRVGYFGAANGVYFEQTNGTKNMVIRSSSSGSLVEDRHAQSTWNTDKLDGTGPSGLTLDTAATQIFWCDIEWLGVGSVRTGFIINGQFIVCHIFHHANDPTYTTTYMGSATLPCRYEITNTDATSGASTMQQICTTVISEGGYTASTQVYTAGSGVTPKRLSTAGTYYPIASIRLNSTHLNSIVKLGQVDMLSPTVNYYRWVVLKNATLTGATWTSAFNTVRIDVDTAATAVTGGIEMESGYISSRETTSFALDNIYGQLSRTLAGVSDTFTLAMAATSNNADVLAQIGWQEIL